MVASNPLMNNFNGGELSPLAYARVNLEKYPSSVKDMRNYVGQLQGGATRRPGTPHVAPSKDTQNVRVIPFVFSDDDAFVLEFGDGYIRFYQNRAQVLNLGIPYEISSPYTAADLAKLSFVQSADVMYLACTGYEPRTLSRLGTTNWTLTTTTLNDGPYLDTNSTATTITPSATTGAGITLTASAATFAATDVGRVVRLRHTTPTVWGWARITAYTSATVVTATVGGNFGATTATANWRLGSFSNTTGWPGVVALVEDRLAYGGGSFEPFSVRLSRTGDYLNFAPTETDGQVVDDNAVSVSVVGGNGASGRVDNIRWIIGDEKGIFIGTTGGEWVLRASSLSEPVTPSNSQVKQVTVIGSNDTLPVRVGGAVLFVQRTGRKVRKLAYTFQTDGFKAEDLTLLAEHITKGQVKEMAYQQNPNGIIWVVLATGDLVALTFEPDQEVYGWHRHPLGGTNAQVISVCCVPSPDGTLDDTWFVVRRTVNGATVQYVEYLSEFNSDYTAPEEFFFVDSGIKQYNATAFTSVTGLDHLEGETVAVLADGAAHPNKVVSGGAITLDRPANTADVGLGYTSVLGTLRLETGATKGTAQGRMKRIQKIFARVHQTVGMKAGRSLAALDTIPFRSSADLMDEALPTFSGDIEIPFAGQYDRDAYIVITQEQPLPSTILGLFPEMVVYD